MPVRAVFEGRGRLQSRKPAVETADETVGAGSGDFLGLQSRAVFEGRGRVKDGAIPQTPHVRHLCPLEMQRAKTYYL